VLNAFNKRVNTVHLELHRFALQLLAPGYTKRSVIIKGTDFLCFDALKIESNIPSTNFSITYTVLVSFLYKCEPICFLSKDLFGFSSIDDVTQFAY
jgi:hypothetical protein